MRVSRWFLAAALAVVAVGGVTFTGPAPAQAAPAGALLLGDSVLASISSSAAAKGALARHSYVLDAEVCRRLITTSCSSQGRTPNTALEALVAAAGSYTGVLVVEAGYNDSTIATAVDRIVAEARRQGVTTILWLTYHQDGANAATYARHNDTLRQKTAAYPELRLVDFHTAASRHPEWFAADRLHLNALGATGLATIIAGALDGVAASRPTAPPDPPVCTAADAPAGGATTDDVPTGGLHALPAPVRFLDTRPDADTATGERVHDLAVAGRLGVPSDAVAVIATVTAVAPCGPAYLTAFPCGTTPPTTSNVNAAAGATVANAAVVRLSADGHLCVFANTGTDVLVDVSGWIGPGGDTVTPLSPVRSVDTRRGTTQRLGVPQQRLAAGVPLVVRVTDDPAATVARQVALNLTAVDPAAAGFLSVSPGPCAAGEPATSSLNVAARATTAAAVIATVGPDGTVCVYSSVATDVIVDLGATAGDGGDVVAAVTPSRLADTRVSGTRVAAGTDLVLDLDDEALGAPPGATGAVLNLTAVSPAGTGYVTVTPCAADGSVPHVSNLNLTSGATVANLVVTAAGEGRRICIRPSVTTHLLVDVQAWLLPTV